MFYFLKQCASLSAHILSLGHQCPNRWNGGRCNCPSRLVILEYVAMVTCCYTIVTPLLYFLRAIGGLHLWVTGDPQTVAVNSQMQVWFRYNKGSRLVIDVISQLSLASCVKVVDKMRVKEHGKVGGCCSPAHLGGFLHCLFPTAGILGSVNIHSIYMYTSMYVYSMWIFQGCNYY